MVDEQAGHGKISSAHVSSVNCLVEADSIIIKTYHNDIQTHGKCRRVHPPIVATLITGGYARQTLETLVHPVSYGLKPLVEWCAIGSGKCWIPHPTIDLFRNK